MNQSQIKSRTMTSVLRFRSRFLSADYYSPSESSHGNKFHSIRDAAIHPRFMAFVSSTK